MSGPGAHSPRVALSLRALAGRFGLGLLVGLSVLLLLLGKLDMKLANLLADHLNDVSAPVLQVIVQPVVAVRSGVDRIGALLAVYDENVRLREENRRLLSWQTEAARLNVQNQALRRQLNVPPVGAAPAWTTARIVADSGGVFVRTLLVDAGTDQGVMVGMPALTPAGLVGRVVDVGRRSARILLITDFNSRIPVVVERSGDQAILEGDNGGEPSLRFLPINPSFAVGDRVLTSGRGGMLPPGLLVGQVAAVTGAQARVRSYVDWSRLDYLSLLHYQSPPPPEDRSGE